MSDATFARYRRAQVARGDVPLPSTRADRGDAPVDDRAERHDRGAMSKPRAENGQVVYVGRAARTGPLIYQTPDGDQIERRDESEVRRIARQLDRGVPVRVGHGGEQVGVTRNGRVEDDHATAELVLDSAGARAVSGGRRELSIGYRCRVDGSGYQRGIETFELALVHAARCGPSCSIRSDCAGECSCAADERDGAIDAHELHVQRQVQRGEAPLPSQQKQEEEQS
jgi:hypothetical protein